MIIRQVCKALLIVTLGCFISGIATASTTGYGPGDPQSGLVLALGLLAIIVVFACMIMLVAWAQQRRVEKMKERRDVSGLIAALHSPSLSAKAASALVEIGDDSVRESLESALFDEHEDVRRASARALGILGDERAIEPLTRALGDKYAGVRDCARFALDKIKEKSRSS